MKNKKGAIEMSIGTIVIIVIALILLVLIIIFFKHFGVNHLVFSDDYTLEKDWACMDGCYNMLEVLFVNVSYENVTQKLYHDKCADVCHKQYVVKK
jgi:hypothetical protein